MLHRAILIGAAAGGVALLAACGASAPASPDADFVQISQLIDADLNGPLAAARERLDDANSDGRIFAEELKIRSDGQAMPVDWWLYDAGYIEVAGSTRGVAWFGLTPAGQAWVRAQTPNWLTNTFQDEPKAVCGRSGPITTCKVTGVAKVQTASQGQGKVVGGDLPPVSFAAEMRGGRQGWQVTSVTPTSKPGPADVGRVAIFGDDAKVAAARRAFAAKVNATLG